MAAGRDGAAGAAGLGEISTVVGKVRAVQDTLTIDYSVLPVDDFGPLVDID